MIDPDLADYGPAFLEDLPADELQRERAHLFTAIPYLVRNDHPRELQLAKTKLVAITAALKAQRDKKKETPPS